MIYVFKGALRHVSLRSRDKDKIFGFFLMNLNTPPQAPHPIGVFKKLS